MSENALNSWRSIQDEVVRRIQLRIWKPGQLIPNEADLSEEFGCARATVNRALRQLAEEGLLDRKRRAGTRVALTMERRARLEIPVIRTEIEDKEMSYRYSLLSRKKGVPPASIRQALRVDGEASCLHVVALHFANRRPYVHEDRWIDLNSVPSAISVDFSEISANEWLLSNIPFERGEIRFSATNAKIRIARHLRCNVGASLFTVDRSTEREGEVLTAVRLTFAPGYQMQAFL